VKVFSGLLVAILAIAQSPTLTELRFGGAGQDTLAGFAIDAEGNYYLAGTTSSFDLPATTFQPRPGGASLFRVRPGNLQPLFPGDVTTIAASGDGTLYAAYSRAIWTSTDNANTWRRLNGPWPTRADCTGIATGPGVLYVLCPDDSQLGSGSQHLFRSYDRGGAWSRLPVINFRLASITVDPANPRSLFARNLGLGLLDFRTGVRSLDAGETWSQIIGINLLQFAFHPTNPRVVFASDGYSLYRSSDSGSNWTKLPSPQDADRFASGASLAVLPSCRVFPLSGNRLHAFDGTAFTSYPLPSDDPSCWLPSGSPGSALLATSPATLYLTLCGHPSSSVYRSENGGLTWTRLNPHGLPAITGHVLMSSGDYFVTVRESLDGFVAKLRSDGTLVWSTYLGGVQDDAITALTLDAAGSVYVTGTTRSTDFPVTAPSLAFEDPLAATQPHAFAAKLSASGETLVYARTFAYGAQTRAIAVDSAGAAYLAGNAGPSLPTTAGAYQRYVIDLGFNPFVLKLNPTGASVDYATFLAPPTYAYFTRLFRDQPQYAPIEAHAIAVDSDGHAYVGGTYIWKLNPHGTDLVYSTRLEGGTVRTVAIDQARNLYVGGKADTESFFTTHAAFQTFVPPTICSFDFNPDGTQRCSALPGFVTKFNAEASSIPYSTYLGGDAWDTVLSLAVRPDGSVVAGGQTESRAFPTRAPVHGPMLGRLAKVGFLTTLTPAGDAVTVSTYAGATESWQPVALALDPTGNPILAGNNLTDNSDIVLSRLEASNVESLNPRLDGVLNSANGIATPLAPSQRVALPGAGFQPGALVCFGEAQCVEPIAASPTELIASPGDLPDTGPVAVYIQLPSGTRSNTVLMPAGPAEFAVYPASATGVLARHDDGTFNSPANPARRGVAITIPFNGARPTLPIGGLIDVSFSTGPFPGLPGEVPLFHATVDPNLPPSIRVIGIGLASIPGRPPLMLSIAPPLPD